MKILITLIFLVSLMVSCSDVERDELIGIEKSIQSWGTKDINWNKKEGFSHSFVTSKGRIDITTRTITIEEDGTYNIQGPTLKTGQFMIGPSMKTVNGINQLIKEVKRSFHEGDTVPFEQFITTETTENK